MQRQLIAWLLGLLTVVGLGAGGVSYWLAHDEAGSLLDQQLRQIARNIGSTTVSVPRPSESEEEQENAVVVQRWDADGALRSSSRPGFSLPRHPATGFWHARVNGQQWRVYTRVEPTRTVQVAQWEEVRREVAANAALRALLAVIVLIPLAWFLVVIAVGRILKPLGAVTAAAARRDAASLAPLPTEGVPEEVVPLLHAMNDLLIRLREAIESQRNFLSDAAHELRTPLAALQLQLENLASSQDRDACIAEMRGGLQRASHLVGQLLKMARFEATTERLCCEVDLGDVAKAAIADLMPLAEDRGIDLGMVRDETAIILASPADIRVLIDNLLDNAIRYTPAGGRVDVGIGREADRVTVEISDNGPGIDAALLPRVFDRFYRAGAQDAEGSGIGLAIVRAIAGREGAEVQLANRSDGHGLIAKVTFTSAG